MTIKEDTVLASKQKKEVSKIGIHYIFICNKSGICIYGLNLTNRYLIEQEQLISSYFTALMSFTNELIGNKIKTIEMGGGLKLVAFEKKSLFYCILCNDDEHIEHLNEMISKIHSEFMKYVLKNKVRIDLEYVNDNKLNSSIEDIIATFYTNEYDLLKEEEIITYLKSINAFDEINGVLLLTGSGNVVYTSLLRMYVKNFLREVEFRVKICNNSILKMFYTSKKDELIFSEYVNDLYLVILIFDSKTRFGIAEFYLHKIIETIRKFLRS
jgi:hypothetical protein